MFNFRSKNDLLLLKRSFSLDRIRGGRDSYLGYRSCCWISLLFLSILLFLYEKERGRLRGTQSTKKTLQAPGWVANISKYLLLLLSINKVTWGKKTKKFKISLHVPWKYKAIKPMINQKELFFNVICVFKYFVLKSSF